MDSIPLVVVGMARILMEYLLPVHHHQQQRIPHGACWKQGSKGVEILIFTPYWMNILHLHPCFIFHVFGNSQRHRYLSYEGLQYTDADIADFEESLGRIYNREIHQRIISTDRDFLGPPSYTLIRGPVLRLCHRMMAHSIASRSQAPEKVTVTDLFYLRGLDVGSVNIPYLLARYLRRFAAGRKSGDLISGGQFVARLVEHFGLLTEERLQGLTMIMRELPIIDMAELVRLQICIEIDDTWAWVALRPERQPDVADGVPKAAEDAPTVDEGDQAILIPVQAPQQLPPPPPATGRTMPQRLGRLEEEVQLMEARGQTFQAFDGTFWRSSPATFQRHTRMDDPNITMEEYIRLEEEKARKHGKLFNKETANYGKIWYDEDIHDLRSVETEFLAIDFNDSLKSGETLSCEPTVSSLNDEIDFKISFDNSGDEDYTLNLDNSTNNVLIPLDSWTSRLLEYKLPLSSLRMKSHLSLKNDMPLRDK
uniref:Uncharacterized protein n=1 Tax=Tanacetum cinerariifolium TaxID=118510 RepID=A0A6L2K383_TANCI|nr:hypothetical protein [Tanacetum cinerariifolium]